VNRLGKFQHRPRSTEEGKQLVAKLGPRRFDV
jgi:hypothetical protein